MKYLPLFFIAIFFHCHVYGQDTISVMHYNLLNYGDYYGGCNEENNNIDDKSTLLKKIVKYTQPDIFSVNEIACDANVIDHLVDNALNVDGESKYKKGVLSCTSLPYISNVLFYNYDKLRYYSHHPITTNIRDININTLYYYSDDLGSGDTAFIHCVVAHLKAGNDNDDAEERALETEALMDYLELNVRGNILLMGDLNVYNSTEECFQNLVNSSIPGIQFYDPINQIGNWHNNEDYVSYHTQSTHANDDGCPASGGMDDRFDFILFNQSILSGTNYFSYIVDSYKTIGQDGNHFNLSVNSGPANTSVPSDILNALFSMSDHLPILLKLNTTKNLSIDENYPLSPISIISMSEGILRLEINSLLESDEIRYCIYDIYGRKVLPAKAIRSSSISKLDINIHALSSGIYILKFEALGSQKQSLKFIKN